MTWGALALLLARSCSAEASLRFLVVGDWGREGIPSQAATARAMAREAKSFHPGFVVSTGDNIYNSGVSSVADPKWNSSFETVYADPSLTIPWYAVLGNHDYYGNPQAEVSYTSKSPRWKMPDRYFDLQRNLSDGTGVELLFLDTNPFEMGPAARIANPSAFAGTDTARQLRWLDSALTRSKARWKIAIGHHPIWSSGEHGPELGAMPPRFARRFADHGVDLYLAGHDHDLEHLFDPSSGIHQVVSGAGSSLRRISAGRRSLWAASENGFAAVEISRDSLVVRFIDTAGTVQHRFSLGKSKP